MGTAVGEVAVVTGAGSGIGRAMAERFLAAGYAVVAADIEIDGVPPEASRVKADVSAPDDAGFVTGAQLVIDGGLTAGQLAAPGG